jgi:hypothetical protein
VAIHFWQNFNGGLSLTCSPSSLIPQAQGATPFKPPTVAFRCAARRPRGSAGAGRGPALISGEVLEAGIELSFGGNAKLSGIGFSPTRRDFRLVRSGSGPPDFCSCTLKVPRSAVGSGSGRPEPARPMSQLGSICLAHRHAPNGRFRRIFTVPAGSGEGPLIEPIAAAQPWRRERVLMPLKRPCRQAPEPAELGGKAAFPICPACDGHALKAAIYCLKIRHLSPHANFGAPAGRSTGRGISSFIRGCRSSEPRITSWT